MTQPDDRPPPTPTPGSDWDPTPADVAKFTFCIGAALGVLMGWVLAWLTMGPSR